MVTQKAIRQVIAQIRTGFKDPVFDIIKKQNNHAYFVHRTIEAIHAGHYWLACRLLIILLAEDKNLAH